MLLPQIPSTWKPLLVIFLLDFCTACELLRKTWQRVIWDPVPHAHNSINSTFNFNKVGVLLENQCASMGQPKESSPLLFQNQRSKPIFCCTSEDIGIPEKVKQYFFTFCKTSTKFLKLANLTFSAPHKLLLSPKSSKKTMHHHTSIFSICCHFSIWNLIFFFPNKSPPITKASLLCILAYLEDLTRNSHCL